MRNVNASGLSTAMAMFFAKHDREPAANKPHAGSAARPADDEGEDEAVCEEILLEAFSH